MAATLQSLKRLFVTKQQYASSCSVLRGLKSSFALASSLSTCSTDANTENTENNFSCESSTDVENSGCKIDDDGESLSYWVGGSINSPPHSSVYFKKLDSLCKSGDVDEANKFLTVMLEKNFRPKAHFFNSVIVGYAKAGRCEESLKVCSVMRTFGYRPHLTAYNSLISAKFKQGKALDALDLFDKLQRDGWQPNEITKSIVAFGLCKTGHTQQVISLVQQRILKGGISASTSVCNALINSLVATGRVNEAREFGKQMFSGLCLPNVFTYAALIRGCCKQGDMKAAREFLLDMDRRGCKPNLACYGTLISQLCRMNKFQDAFFFFEQMVNRGISAEGAFCDLLLCNLSTQGMMDEAMWLCNYVADKGIYVRDATFHLLLEGLSKADRIAEANEVLENLIEKDCLSDASQFEQALRVFQRRQTLLTTHGSV